MAYFNVHKKLTTSQFVTIVNRRKEKGNMRLNLRNLSSVDPQVLTKSILDPEFLEVELKDTNLTRAQLETIFTQTALIPGKDLGRLGFILDVSQNDLSEVHPIIMAKAAVKMDQIDLSDTCLSMEQAEVLFKTIIDTKDLKIDYLTVDKHLCKGKNYKLAKAVAERIELNNEFEARSEEMKKYYKEDGMGACIQAMMLSREGDQDEEELLVDDYSDYEVDEEEDDAKVDADYRRSETDYIRKYCKVIVEEEFKKRGKL